MRILTLCLFALFLGGCAQSGPSAPEVEPVKLYKTEAELSGASFKEMGLVSGDSCQFTAQDSPPSITSAMLSMQKRAAYKEANAVLLHRCEMMSSVPGCYQVAVCEGTALHINF
ncbi:Rcs stress response system protein RcsF [Jinshanibacter sp. LJY008]|uniref:Rcs stress response system protein RcsF n=1 Tax=Limnobaculum eriocheiris TaxID=2897391 RepID=A0A9X1MZE3_9GAMM|nr:Rcs stress response system protein RcsF [Limnobaculum eriocheiris]MCD1127709.1 Rcs stress response system protein RcsF [Limnobaculum eriocheiris]